MECTADDFLDRENATVAVRLSRFHGQLLLFLALSGFKSQKTYK